MQGFQGAGGRNGVVGIWILIVGAVLFMSCLIYLSTDLRDGGGSEQKPATQCEQTEPALDARSQDEKKDAADRNDQSDYERLKADAEHRLDVLSYRQAEAGAVVASQGVEVSRYAARVSLLGVIVSGVGTLLSAVAAAVAALAFSESRRASAVAIASFSDGRNAQRALLSCRIDSAPTGDHLVIRNVGATPAKLTRMRPGSIPTSANLPVVSTDLRMGLELAELLGPGEEAIVHHLGPAVDATADRVFDVSFEDVYGEAARVQARFGPGPGSRIRKAQQRV